MNETITTDHVKDELPVIYLAQDESGKVSPWFRGRPRELGDIMIEPFTNLIKEQPEMRRELRRAVRRVKMATAPEWIRYWLDAWPLTLIGSVLIWLAVYGISFVLHWIGV